jgi:hypothetical protein
MVRSLSVIFGVVKRLSFFLLLFDKLAIEEGRGRTYLNMSILCHIEAL